MPHHTLPNLLIAPLASAALFIACDPAAPPPYGDVADVSTTLDTTPEPPPLRFGTNATDLFRVSRIAHFDLRLPPERFDYMQSHAALEKWEPADLTFEGAPVGRVAMRFKGGAGTLLPCVDANTGRLVCKKVSLKLKFSEYEPGRRFYGLKRLNLHAMTRDRSLVRERLSYDLFAAVGIPAPRHAWAVVTINGEPWGVFGMVEEIDGRFTDERWPERGNGNLYKGVWPSSERVSDYEVALVTQPDDGSVTSHDAMLQFAAELRFAPPGQRRDAASPFVDLDLLARTLAVYDAILGWDGPTAFWTCPDDAAPCANQNTVWYQLEQRRFFQLIPWDMDQTFSTITPVDFVPHWTDPAAACEAVPLHDAPARVGAIPPGCDPLLAAVAEDLGTYHTAIADLLAGPLAPPGLERKLDLYEELLAPLVAADPRGPSVASWRAELDQVREVLPIVRARLARLAEGAPVSVAGLASLGTTDFEHVDTLALALGLWRSANPGSAIGATPGRAGALAGDQDFQIAFTLANGESPFATWAQVGLRFAEGPQNLLRVRQLSLSITCDTARRVRVELDSPLYEFSGSVARHGWEFDVGPEPITVTLPLQTASPPAWLTSYTGPALATVRSEVRGLRFQPLPSTTTAEGWLPAPELGTLRIDDITLE